MPQLPYLFGPDSIAPHTYPFETVATTVAAPAAQWTFPATWTQVVASTSAGFVLCGAVVTNFGAIARQVVIEIGTGGAGSESRLAMFDVFGYINGVVDDSVSFIVSQAQLLGPFYIPSGTRIAARQAQSVTATFNASQLILYGYNVASPEIAARIINQTQLLQGFATRSGERLPNTDFVTLTHAGSAWANGAWVEIESALDYDTVIEGSRLAVNTSGRTYTVQFGYGSAGNEVPLPAFYPMPSVSVLQPEFSFVPSPLPLYVPAGQRLVARQKANSTSGTIKVAANVTYLK